MSADASRPRRVSVWAHPILVVVVAAVLVVVGVILTLSAHASPAAIRRSLLVGLEIGVPYWLYFKWAYRRNIGFYAEIAAKGWLRMTFEEQMHHLVVVLPPMIVFFMVFFPWLLGSHRTPPAGPVMALWGILSIIVYPEWKAIYRAAQARIAQSGNDPGEEETTG